MHITPKASCNHNQFDHAYASFKTLKSELLPLLARHALCASHLDFVGQAARLLGKNPTDVSGVLPT
jgi:hypothetical protein